MIYLIFDNRSSIVPDRNYVNPATQALESKLPPPKTPKKKDVSLTDGYVRLFGGQAED